LESRPGLALGFNQKPALELDIGYWDTGDLTGFTWPRPGVNSTILNV